MHQNIADNKHSLNYFNLHLLFLGYNKPWYFIVILYCILLRKRNPEVTV